MSVSHKKNALDFPTFAGEPAPFAEIVGDQKKINDLPLCFPHQKSMEIYLICHVTF